MVAREARSDHAVDATHSRHRGHVEINLDPQLPIYHALRISSRRIATEVSELLPMQRESNPRAGSASGRLVFDAFRFGIIELGAPQRERTKITAWLGLSHLR
jgi:hypothetical protein